VGSGTKFLGLLACIASCMHTPWRENKLQGIL
jgi:hypothetical protein